MHPGRLRGITRMDLSVGCEGVLSEKAAHSDVGRSPFCWTNPEAGICGGMESWGTHHAYGQLTEGTPKKQEVGATFDPPILGTAVKERIGRNADGRKGSEMAMRESVALLQSTCHRISMGL